MPVRRPWHPRLESAVSGARLFPISTLSVSRRACAAGLVLAVATAGSLTGIITSNHRHGIAQAAAVPTALSTTDQLSTGVSTTTAAVVTGDAAPASSTATGWFAVVAPSKVNSQGHPGVVPVPLVPRAVAGPIPMLAWQAYHDAAASSGCNLPWYLLAGIGKIESNHGRYAGARFDITGTVHPAIYGPPTAYGRAMGPMQFIPPTWASYAADGNGDGVTDPQNVFDATKAAAHYLCRAGGSDLSGAAAQRRAVFAYNHLDSYVADVLAFATAYSHGASESTVKIVPITYPKAATKTRPAATAPASATRKPTASTTAAASTTSASTTTATTTASTTAPTTAASTSGSPATCTTTSSPSASPNTAKAAAGKSGPAPTTTVTATTTTATTTTATSSSAATRVPAASSSSAGCAPCPTATTSAPHASPSTTTSAPSSCSVPTPSATK